MAKFFDEMLAHVRSLTGMRIPFLFVSTAFAGMIFAPAVLLLQLTVEDVTGTYDRIVDLVGNRTPSNWRRLLKADGALVAAAGHTCCCNKIGLTTGVVGGRECVSDGLMKKGKPWL